MMNRSLADISVPQDNYANVCVDFPPNIHSSGSWNLSNIPGLVTNSTLPTLEKQMALAFFTTQFLHLILSCFGIPVFVSQMLAGIILGRSVLGTNETYKLFMQSIVGQDILGTLTMFGYSMFVFLMGVKMDISLVFRTGRKSLYTGISTLLVPLVLTLPTLPLLNRFLRPTEQEMAGLVYVAVANSLTSFPVITTLLGELNLLTSELGRLGASTAIVCDILSLLLGSVIRVAIRANDPSVGTLGNFRNVGGLLSFVLLVVFVARPAMFWVIRQTPKGKPVHNGYIFVILVAALASGLCSHWFDQFFYFGPFVLGLAVPSGPPLGSTLVQRYDFMVFEVILPLFVTSNVMVMNPKAMFRKGGKNFAIASAVVFLVSTLAKLVGSFVPAVCCKMPVMDACILALILSCRGIVELSRFSMAPDALGYNEQLYASALFSVLISATVVPLLVKNLYKPSRRYAGYEQRNIASLRPDSELRILTCIHKQENIASAINLLDACCPTKDSPMTVYVLHLIQMFGHAAPIFISHRMQQKTISNCAYSEDVLLAFLQFELDFSDGMTVHPFTAICPSKLMHEDICTLALDRATSLVVLPFHRHWTLDGSVKSEDSTIRSLNISVIEKAPCSVGILVNRGPLRQLAQGKNSSSSHSMQYRVAMIFLGGKDDREALALTQRMAADPSIGVTVYCVSTSRETSRGDAPNWERILDMESLRKYRENYAGHRDASAHYVEEVAENGPQTVAILRRIVNQYDLFIVGRREHTESPQTSGLDDWSEFPELGIVGDMLASDDFMCRSSILIVQQQHTST